VTLTLYVHNGSPSGPIISGASVTGSDANGVSFSKTTNSSGYVTITGAPGTWSFSASASGYNTVTWDQAILSAGQRDAYLIPTTTSTSVLPTVQTVSANISQTSVVINGTITSSGGSVVDDRRFDWGATQPLGDAVFAQSISVSGNNFSATLTGLSPNTLYYFRAWAHNGSSANSGYGVGWNTGAILSFTTGASSNISPPNIITQPNDGTIPANGNLVLNVTASGTDLHYRWFRDGTAILGATSSTISVNLPAAYWVIVSSGGGQVTSRHAVVVAATEIAPPPAGQPQPGAATSTGQFDPSLPTVVITHGWQPGETYNGAPPPWVTTMRDAIVTRLDPLKDKRQRANIVLFRWAEAYTISFSWGDLLYAATHTHAEGLRLASELRRVLGTQYNGNVHFIGHSLGTIVNAYAVEDYSHSYSGTVQFTILDAPLKFTPYSSLFFEEHLSRLNVAWVDNYIATKLLPFPPGVGDVIPGSAPNGGLKENENHTGIHDFYIRTIPSGSSNVGFYNSVILNLPDGWQSRPSPQDWHPDFSADAIDVIIDMGAHLPQIAGEGFHLLQGTVQQATDNVRGAVRESIHMITGLFGGSRPVSVQMQKSYATDLLTTQLDSNDASVGMDVSVPATTDTLTFDYRFPTIVTGDWMTVTFNSTLLYSFPADSSAQSDFRRAEVPVASIAGQTGVLMLTLHSTSSTQTELAISNFQFTAAKAQKPKFANIATRLSVGAGDSAMIGGFIITGTQPKTVIVRGIGPSLGAVGVPEPLSDPIIEIHDSTGALIPGGTNDNWHDAVTSPQIAVSGLAPTNDLESAFLGTLNPGAYTVVVRGKDGGTGNGLFEVYDLNPLADSKLGNISTRGFVNTGDKVMIGGTIIVGDSPTNVLVRAIGPSLSNFGISNALSDPVLELHDGNGGLIGSNDNWGDTQETAIIATSIPPTDNRESAILANLQPGQYTAVIRGKNDSTGVAVVEAYHLGTPTGIPDGTVRISAVASPSNGGSVQTTGIYDIGTNPVFAAQAADGWKITGVAVTPATTPIVLTDLEIAWILKATSSGPAITTISGGVLADHDKTVTVTFSPITATAPPAP
jgi:pimeloyl-ACP methyl ester carboxylesterase